MYNCRVFWATVQVGHQNLHENKYFTFLSWRQVFISITQCQSYGADSLKLNVNMLSLLC